MNKIQKQTLKALRKLNKDILLNFGKYETRTMNMF